MGPIARFFSRLWRVLDATRKVLHFVLLFFFFFVLWAVLRPPLPTVPSVAALVVKPQGRLVEQLAGDPVDRAFAEATSRPLPETLLRDVTDAIDAAAKDSRIKVIVLDTHELTGGGFTKLEAVARSLRAFRAQGKKVLAYGEVVTQSQYYLMSQADESWVDPAGIVLLNGFGAYRYYFRDVLDKLGVNVNVFKVGTFKSYVEQYTRNDMSPEDREQTEAWLKPLWRAYGQGVEKARQLPDGSVAKYVDELVPRLRAAGGDSALMAEQGGLISGRKNRVEFDARVTELVGTDSRSHSYRAVRDRDYLALQRPSTAFSRQQVAVLLAVGSIADGDRSPGEIGGESLSGVLREARFDPAVKAIVLRIDSPGGSMTASERIREELDALKAAGKPVVASFSSVAASGGYYIAMDANEIWSEPATITGSIGVFAVVPTFERTLGKLGVGVDGIATSPVTAGARLDRPLSPDVKQAMQMGVEDAYGRFIGHVAESRGKTRAEIDALAQGRVWLAPDALERGLVDHLGSVEQAVQAAAARAHLAEGKYATVWREKHLSLAEAMLRGLRMQTARIAGGFVRAGFWPTGLAQLYDAIATEVSLLARLNDPRGFYYYCNCDLR
jgi:protease-4